MDASRLSVESGEEDRSGGGAGLAALLGVAAGASSVTDSSEEDVPSGLAGGMSALDGGTTFTAVQRQMAPIL